MKGTKRLEQLRKEFNLSVDVIKRLIDDFKDELQAGLEGKPSSFNMIPSFINKLPTGEETGLFYGLDFGGTNLRAMKFEFKGQGQCKVVDEVKEKITKKLRTADDADLLFDFLASCVLKLETQLHEQVKPFGFTFSFPVNQTSVNEGTLDRWTKGFNVKDVVGKDIVELLRRGISRQSSEKGAHSVNIKALMNDTVGTLLSGRYANQNCVMGVILGTGTNCAYIERVENITKLKRSEGITSDIMLINIEWGAFGDLHHNLPSSAIDDKLDQVSVNKGAQHFEKMISGYYLGEIFRLFLVELNSAGELFSASFSDTSPLTVAYSVDSSYLSQLDVVLPKELAWTAFVRFCTEFRIESYCEEDFNTLRDVCDIIIQRAANLVAIAIAALLKQIRYDSSSGTVPAAGIDGSVYELHPSFRKRVLTTLNSLNYSCDLFLAKDGSGKGAALAAAIL